MSKVLLIGSGGREHALANKLSQSALVSGIIAVPGSYGIGQVPKVENFEADINNFEEIAKICLDNEIEVVVVGPEVPLCRGIVDSLARLAPQVSVFGPNATAARIEGDKAWAKQFMRQYQIPTPQFSIFNDSLAAIQFIRKCGYAGYVVKASGLAGGKGVIVTQDMDEAEKAVISMMDQHSFGNAGDTVVIEEMIFGREVSVLGFTDGKDVLTMVPAEDHKRLLDGDEGPNTGGMGAYAPSVLLSKEQLQHIEQNILKKTISALQIENIKYVGVLYAGIMLTEDGPKVLEFNCRFGDPETQVILPLLKSDLFKIIKCCLEGSLRDVVAEWREGVSAVGVVLSAPGYPQAPVKGSIIKGLSEAGRRGGVEVYYCGVDKDLKTSGGRVAISVALSSSLPRAAHRATQTCSSITFPGAHFRKDIAHKAIPRWLLDVGGKGSYAGSGVDIEAGDHLVESIKGLAGYTRPGVVSSVGGFAALYSLAKEKFNNPLLVTSTDGVGTKAKVGAMTGLVEGLGQDLVAMCVNDVLCHGGEPLFFLDYFATSKLTHSTAITIINSIAQACADSKCTLIGGETAEMPGVYREGEFDLAGFVVGVVEEGKELPKLDSMEASDLLIGLPSSGLHSNGFSLVRNIVQKSGLSYADPSPFSELTLGEEVMKRTLLYSEEVLPLVRRGLVKGIAHVTGGGIVGNVSRVTRKELRAVLDASLWTIPPIFPWIALQGGVGEREMLRVFNMGLGLILVIGQSEREAVLSALPQASVVGQLRIRNPGESSVEVVGLGEALEGRMKAQLRSLSFAYKRIAVLISGTGTNLQALIDGVKNGQIDGEIVLVISNKEGVEGLRRAQEAGIPTKVIRHGDYGTREEFEVELNKELCRVGCELVVLAGFMRVLTTYLVSRWRGKMINVHPALLPSFKGLDTHARALRAGVSIHGATVHFVHEDVDSGAIIEQAWCRVKRGETAKELEMRVKGLEHTLLPKAVQLLCSGALTYDHLTNTLITNTPPPLSTSNKF